jgi:Na+/H+ antiporter NhaC
MIMSLEKKINYATWLSIISILLWLIVVVLWLFNVYEFSVVDSNTFIGVIVALLALIVTFIVGWQIFNVLDVKA